MELLKKVYKLLILFWNAQKLAVEQPWRAFGAGTALTKTMPGTSVPTGNPPSSESKPRSNHSDEMLWIHREAFGVDFTNYLEQTRITLPVLVTEVDFAKAPLPFEDPPFQPQIFHQVINHKQNE